MLDFLTLRNALVGGGIGIVVLLTLIQITPIKLNPLSYIARKLGDALNASQSEKFESFKKQLEALDKKVEDLKNHVDESEIKTTRIKILRGKFIAMMLIKKFYMLLMNINYIVMNTQILLIIWQNVVSQRLKRLMNYIEPNITF